MIFNYVVFNLKGKIDCYLLLWKIFIVGELEVYYYLFFFKEFNILLI